MNMEYELLSASNFLVHLIRLAKTNVSESQLKKFRDILMIVLQRRYKEHWFPDKPLKGSGYRCIRINGKMDPVIGQAGESCGLSSSFLHSNFPTALTIWIDPHEVSYRIGENGSICVLYEFLCGVNEPWKPAFQRKKTSNIKKGSFLLTFVKTVLQVSQKIFFKNKNGVVISSKPEAPMLATTSRTRKTPSYEESMRMNYLLDPKQSVSIEKLATMVLN